MSKHLTKQILVKPEEILDQTPSGKKPEICYISLKISVCPLKVHSYLYLQQRSDRTPSVSAVPLLYSPGEYQGKLSLLSENSLAKTLTE